MKTTRSTARKEVFSAFTKDILPILIGEGGGWVDAADLAAIQTTCRSANQNLTSAAGDHLWKTLAMRRWPDVGSLVVADHDGAGDDSNGDKLPTRNQYPTYRDLFVNYPRVWLAMASAKVESLPEWSRKQHLSKDGGILECGKCGCNCSNGSLCPGIPMTSEYRWERKEKLGYYECRVVCPSGEGYQMSSGMFVATNYFCELCFDRMIELEVVKREDYDRVGGTSIFEETTNYIVNEEGTNPWQSGSGGCFHCDRFFTNTDSDSWQKNLGMDTDDAAIVISNALIGPSCAHKYLNIASLHFNDDFSERGYQAFAYALSINTSLESITMYVQECCRVGFDDPNADRSNGLFAKALMHNRSTNLQDATLCYAAFGDETLHKLEALLKSPPPLPTDNAGGKRKAELLG